MYIPKTDGVQNIKGAKSLLQKEGYSLEYSTTTTETGDEGWAVTLVSPGGKRFDIIYDSKDEEKVFINAERLLTWIGKMTPKEDFVRIPLLKKHKE